MRRILAILFVCIVALFATACIGQMDDTSSPVSQVDDDFTAGKAALEAGNYAEAYARLSASTAEEAATLLEKLVYVPTKRAQDNEIYTVYQYDKNGNLVFMESDYGDYGATTNYTYNEKGQLIYIESVNAEKVKTTTAYTYDEAGNRVTQEWNCDGETTKYELTYDSQHRCLTKKQINANGDTFLTTYRYDVDGNKTYERIDYPDDTWYEQNFLYITKDKPLREWGSDSNGGNYESTYVYDEAGLLQKYTVAGEEHTYAYDEKGQLIQENNPDGTVITYTYDEAGNRVTEKHAVADGNEYITTHTYDESGRLLSAENNHGGWRKFTYDENGNKRTEAVGGDTEKDYSWEYEWELHYYPDGVPEEVEEIRTSNVNPQSVM